jgi:aminoglycoside phosphotransferase (APT) family kinase protein
MATTVDDGTEQITAWLRTNIGGKVVRINRQPRWRPVWFADVEREGETLELCVRGDRLDMPLIFPLDHEMRLQATMHDHGIPTAKVYGWIDKPMAYVMDRVPGRNDFEQSTDAERRAAVDDYLQILARLHSLDIAPFVDAGIMRAPTPQQSGTFGLSRYEKVYRSIKVHPDPFMEFCLAWLRRNPPDSKQRESAIVWDSGQFHHQDGRIVAVLDVEIGHIGDPMMDLAAWRMRDTIIGYGNFAELYDRYSEITGEPIDLDAIQRHHFAFTLTNQLPLGAALRVGSLPPSRPASLARAARVGCRQPRRARPLRSGTHRPCVEHRWPPHSGTAFLRIVAHLDLHRARVAAFGASWRQEEQADLLAQMAQVARNRAR